MKYLILENVINHHNKGRVCHNFPGLIHWALYHGSFNSQKHRACLPHPVWGFGLEHSHVVEILLPERQAERPAILIIHSTSTLKEEVLFRWGRPRMSGPSVTFTQAHSEGRDFYIKRGKLGRPWDYCFHLEPCLYSRYCLGEGNQCPHPPLQRDSTQKTYTNLYINVRSIINHNGCRCLVAESCPILLHTMDCM